MALFEIGSGWKGKLTMYMYTPLWPLMHNSEPRKYAVIKRVCYSAVPCAEHCEQACHSVTPELLNKVEKLQEGGRNNFLLQFANEENQNLTLGSSYLELSGQRKYTLSKSPPYIHCVDSY